jgi:hypothetical protein
MVLKLLSTFLPLDCGSDGRYLQHMPVLHALISGISSLDAVHILSIYGLVRILYKSSSTLFLDIIMVKTRSYGHGFWCPI